MEVLGKWLCGRFTRCEQIQVCTCVWPKAFHRWLTTHLSVFVSKNVPTMLEDKLLSLPHLKKQHGPDGHEGGKEDCPSVVKEKAGSGCIALVLQVPEVAPHIADWTHIEGGVSGGPDHLPSGLVERVPRPISFTGVSTVGWSCDSHVTLR